MSLVVIDAAHLFAAAGRCCGLGARRRSSGFDVDRLLAAILALLPQNAAPQVRWYDASNAGLRTPAPLGHAKALVEVVTTPLRGGRQRNVEALVLRDVLGVLASTTDRAMRLYLLGDPRRHAVTLETISDLGVEPTLIGVSDGEPTPAARIWLRRPEVVVAVRAERGIQPSRTMSKSGYTAPDVRSSPVRVTVNRASASAHPPAEGLPTR